MSSTRGSEGLAFAAPFLMNVR
ncbi:MAG: hypothetical protein RIS88_1052, partial [Pseudomonadota bacterium]